MSWKCKSCNLTNNDYNKKCANSKCKEPNPIPVGNRRDFIDDWNDKHLLERRMMNEREELYAKFYADEGVNVANLSYEQLEDRIRELQVICTEAKAKLARSENERTERKSKLSRTEREKLINSPDLNTTDAINSVNRRKERLTKMEKLEQSLRALGIEDIKSITSTVKVDESKVNYFAFNANKDKAALTSEQSKTLADEVIEKAKVEASKEPFDPSKLFGK
jgi:hypothetical protein